MVLSIHVPKKKILKSNHVFLPEVLILEYNQETDIVLQHSEELEHPAQVLFPQRYVLSLMQD